MSELIVKPVAHIHTDFKEKFGTPRQSGRVDALEGVIVFEPEYRIPEALRGIEAFSHLWLIFDFSVTISLSTIPSYVCLRYARISFSRSKEYLNGNPPQLI